METEMEMMRKNEAFEGGVQAFMAYVASDDDGQVETAYETWREWSKHHPSMSVDAQVEARRRWVATR